MSPIFDQEPEKLAAMSDDAEAVILEVSKAVSAALDEFHFAVEALGDAIVFGEAPHTGDGLSPRAEGIGQGDQGIETALGALLDKVEELSGKRAAFPTPAVLLIKESADTVHEAVKRLQSGISGEKHLEAGGLSRGEPIRPHP